MINKKASICFEGAIWDLHIHSCRCPKSSGDFKKLNVNDYIELLDSIFKFHPELKMISFTDHNSIDKDVYKYALSKEWDITLIIGVEVDTFLDEEGKHNNDIKHVVFYFDPSKFNLDVHCDLINMKLKNSPILLNEFLGFLITDIKVPFLISPHFMKQDKRGIEYKWTGEEEVRKNIDKYIDQMFCFWETSSAVYIQRAIQYLKDFDRDQRVSIIAFSDSSDQQKLEEYLNKPHQYFNALPSFEGIRMVGSDVRRITQNKQYVKKEDMPLYIGKVIQGDNNVIYLSSKLNTIIGGRGTGKSLFVDGIAYKLKPELITENNDVSDREDYLKELNFQVFDLSGNPLVNHDFNFEYFNQGYVLGLFKKNDYDRLSELYLKDEFYELESFDVSKVKERIKEDISFKKMTLESNNENLASLCEKIIVLDDKESKNIFKAKKEAKCLEYLDFDSAISALTRPSVLPRELKDNKVIALKRLELLETTYNEINKYNIATIKNNFYSSFYSKYAEILSEKSNSKKDKINTINLLNSKFRQRFIPILNRVARINAIIGNTAQYSAKRTSDVFGFENNKFTFSKELIVQNLLSYLHNVFCQYFDKAKINYAFKKDRDKIENLSTLIDIYCYYPERYLLSSKSLQELENELDNLDSLDIKTSNEVYYSRNGAEPIKLRNVSPGTKANILMEYIVFKKTSIPLLIDQPEDNIDNKTIYNDLTNWFNDLKIKRQVIVATHDANIVVNADAENIIVCEQTGKDVFNYKNGALEYSNIIDDVSTILDGGKDALERRLAKYGKAN